MTKTPRSSGDEGRVEASLRVLEPNSMSTPWGRYSGVRERAGRHDKILPSRDQLILSLIYPSLPRLHVHVIFPLYDFFISPLETVLGNKNFDDRFFFLYATAFLTEDRSKSSRRHCKVTVMHKQHSKQTCTFKFSHAAIPT